MTGFFIFLGFLCGGAAGVLIGNWNVYYRLNKTNLLGEKEESGNSVPIANRVIPFAAGIVMAIAGATILALSSHMEGTIFMQMVMIGGIFLLGGFVIAFGSVKNLLKNGS